MLFDPPAELPVNLAFLILAKKLPDTFLSLKSILSPPFPLFAGLYLNSALAFAVNSVLYESFTFPTAFLLSNSFPTLWTLTLKSLIVDESSMLGSIAGFLHSCFE